MQYSNRCGRTLGTRQLDIATSKCRLVAAFSASSLYHIQIGANQHETLVFPHKMCLFFLLLSQRKPWQRPCIYIRSQARVEQRSPCIRTYTVFGHLRARVSAHARRCVCTGGVHEQNIVHDWLAGVVRAGVAIAASTRLITALSARGPARPRARRSPLRLSSSVPRRNTTTRHGRDPIQNEHSIQASKQGAKPKEKYRFASCTLTPAAARRAPVWIWLARPAWLPCSPRCSPMTLASIVRIKKGAH